MITTAERLREALTTRNMKQAELSELTGIGKSSISTYLSGDYMPKQRNIYKIAKVLDVNEAWLMGEDVPINRMEQYSTISPETPTNIIPLPQTKQIPLLGTIACGLPILAIENMEETVSMPDYIHADFALRCQGDSMIDARIYDGDLVYIRSQEDVETGEIAAVVIDNQATLKKVYKTINSLVLQAANSAYQPIVLVGDQLDDVRIIGKAVYFVSPIR